MRGDNIHCNCLSCVIYMVTITSHIFINLFQTVHFSAVKFSWGNEKNMIFLLIPKSHRFAKNLKRLDQAPFKLDFTRLIIMIIGAWTPIKFMFGTAFVLTFKMPVFLISTLYFFYYQIQKLLLIYFVCGFNRSTIFSYKRRVINISHELSWVCMLYLCIFVQ